MKAIPFCALRILSSIALMAFLAHPSSLQAQPPVRAEEKRIPTNEEIAEAKRLNKLRDELLSQGRFAEAEPVQRTIASNCIYFLGEEYSSTLRAKFMLAGILNKEGKFVEAEKEFRSLLAVQQRVLWKDHADTLRTRDGLAVAISGQGKHDAAVRELREVLGLMDDVLGSRHPDVWKTRNNLAVALDEQGNHFEAEHEHRAVLDYRANASGPEKREVFDSCYNLAVCLEDQKRWKEALEFIRRAEAGWGKDLGAEHPNSKLAQKVRQRIEAVLRK